MPFCPECRAEYRLEIRRCAECDVELVDSLPEKSAANTGEGLGLVKLASFPNFSEAEMIKELLDGNGIQTVLRGEADPIGVASGAAPSTLLVEERDLSRAREIYEDYFAGDGVQEEDQPSDLT